MHTVWLGSAGTATTYGIARSLRERWGTSIRLIAADINPKHLVAATALCDRFERVPPVVEHGFADKVVELLLSVSADTYVPILDEEIVCAAGLREQGRLSPKITTTAPDGDAARLCFDKLACARRLVRDRIPTPETQSLAEVKWAGLPIAVKPRNGRGSVGFRVLASEEEVEAARSDETLIAQPVCRGPEITIDAFRAKDERVVRALCRERMETKAGVCTKARVFEDPDLSELALRVMRSINLHGTCCIQVMRSGTEEGWLVTDVNPRPGGGTRMSVAVGVDFHSALLADAWGEDPAPMLPRLTAERYVVRQYVEHVLA